MDRDDRPKPRLRVEEMMNALMAGEGGFVEHVELFLGQALNRAPYGPARV
jgi:hypothetical protein